MALAQYTPNCALAQLPALVNLRRTRQRLEHLLALYAQQFPGESAG